MRILTLIALCLLPTLVLSATGILILVFGRAGMDIVFGILVLIFSIAALTGGIIYYNLWRQQARIATLQTDFVAKVSHELRTPLASIRMFVDTLRDGQASTPEEQTLCLDIIATETSRLSNMIERLLSWGRMEARRRQYQLRPESVDALVGEALAQIEPQLAASGMRLELDLPSTSPAVAADRAALVETLGNLLNNAIKYARAGERIRVGVRSAKGRVLVEVQDFGPGIPRQEQRKIFERFYRGSAHEVGAIPGSGLGLAMAHLVVQAHGGRLTVRSTPGEGACFILDLPALLRPEAALEVPIG